MMATSKVGNGVAPTKQHIKAALVGAGLASIDNNVLSKCVALASTLNLTPETMAEVWEAHSLNKQNLTELTMHQFEAYRNELIKASSATPSPDIAQSANPRGAVTVTRKREVPPATMVTPMSSSKRQKQPAPNDATSSVDRVAMNGNSVPSPVRSNDTAKNVQATKFTPKLPKYEERTNVGHVVASYTAGHHNENQTNASNSSHCRCVVSTNMNGEDNDVTRFNITEPYRFMFTTLEDRANALEQHLVRMKDAIVDDIEKGKNSNNKNEPNNVFGEPFEEVNIPRQDPSTFVGRICNEAHQGKMNSTSVVLEGSASSCGGARVNVDLSPVQKKESKQSNGFSLFPGQIVAIEGINNVGRKITASRIKEGAPLPPASSSPHEIKSYYYSNDEEEKSSAPLKVLSACGPFTTSQSMDYAPFVDLMHVVLEEAPDVVILMGPFVDTRQKAVQSGRVTCEDEGEEEIVVDYETFFAQKVAAVIEEVFEEKSLETQFIMIPALEDAVAKFVYPQPPLKDSAAKGVQLNIPGADGIEFGSLGLERLMKPSSDIKSRLHCMPNPCSFRINEMVFGVTSTDVLFHMSVEETNKNLPAGSRLRRISQHMVQQQSFYPLFPPNKSVNLDLKQQDGWRMPCQPDVLIVPSKLSPFCAPILEHTMAVNPGHLTKATTGGTYSLMKIHPMKKEKLAAANDDTKITHDVSDRMEVEIKKI